MKMEILRGSNHKARVITKGDTATLFSYETEVAQYNTQTNKWRIKGWHSNTTARHINQFRQKYGASKLTKKQIEDGNY